MIILHGFIFIFLFLIISFLLGDLFSRYLGWERKILSSYVWGIIILLATVQAVAYPLYRLNLSFTLFFIIYSMLLFALTLLALYIAIKRRDFIIYKKEIAAFFTGIKKAPLLAFIFCCVIIFLVFYMFGFYYPTSDDGYYMARSMEVIDQNSMGINVRTAWLGWSEGELPDYTDASTFAFFISFLSYLSGINVTILSKSFFAGCLLLAHIAAICISCDAIFDNKCSFEKKSLVIILYIAFQILSVKASSGGIWMTGYIWNGKSMLPGFIFPMLVASCITLMRRIENLKLREWTSIMLVLMAGISFSIVGLNLPVILYFTYGAAFLILTKFRYFKRIWYGVLITILPVLIYGILSYTFVITGQNDYYESGTTTAIHWFEQFDEACDFFQFVLFALSALYILIAGEKLQKIIFVAAPALLLVTFLNPAFTGPVCKYVTTSLVYWRLWWLMPVYLLPAVAIADLTDKLCDGKIQSGFLCSLLSLTIISGFEIFRYCITDVNYTVIPYAENVGKLINARPELRQNIYGINGAPYAVAKEIEKDWSYEGKPRLLMYFNRNFEIRQYTTDIVMAVGIRDIQLTDNIIPNTSITEFDFMQNYSEITDGKLLTTILDYYDVNYICFKERSAVENIEEFGFTHLADIAGISLWRYQ